jgi:hypothetical protein
MNHDRINTLYSPHFWATMPPFYQEAASNSDVTPSKTDTALSFEEKFKSQLERLNEMGFHDGEENMKALRESDGDIDAAVAYLIYQNMDE